VIKAITCLSYRLSLRPCASRVHDRDLAAVPYVFGGDYGCAFRCHLSVAAVKSVETYPSMNRVGTLQPGASWF
jgi:hypothetical protein